MKWLAPLLLALVIALGSCSGSSSSSGNDAKAEFESRTSISLPAAVSGWEFKGVQVGDTYREYFRFACTREVFLKTAGRLALTPTLFGGSPSSTLWGSDAGEPSPNDPPWWKLASGSEEIFHKEDYSPVANRSVMALWYHEESGFAYFSVSFWD